MTVMLTGVTGPGLPLLDLSEDEKKLIQDLYVRVMADRWQLDLRNHYYNGTMRVQSLGIAIPQQLERLHTVAGWPRIGVDALEERLDVEGFRYPDSTEADADLEDIWQANNLDEESGLVHLDALVYGRGYVTVGTGDDGQALITVESPLDMVDVWDARTRTIRVAFRVYEFEGLKAGTLYKPDETVTLVQDTTGWVVTARDRHKLGRVPVVRMANRARTADRFGQSEITPEIMSITDAACRTLLGMEVAREFYAAPQRYILGATESAFQDADGNAKSAWQTYLGRVLALERDEDGNVPTVGSFATGDPANFTKVLDLYARTMSGLLGLPPHYLGYTTDNPASADAIRSSEWRLVKKAERRSRMFGGAWEEVMRLAVLIQNGTLQDDAHRIETMWGKFATPTLAATTDAIFKQVQMGFLPPSSDVVGEELGYSSTQRARIAADRKADQGASFLAQIATSLQAREARVDKGLASTLQQSKDNPTGVPPTSPPSADGS